MTGNKLSAKAARLDFSALPGLAAPAPTPAEAASRPKTAPGAMMAFANDARSELLRENELLRAKAAEQDDLRVRLQDALNDLSQWDGAKAARLLDAREVRASAYANRHDSSYDSDEFRALRAEIESAGGNVQPVKVRALQQPEASGVRYELVFGHRRHRACLELGVPLLAVVDNLDDRTLFVEMERENRARKDLSAWEQGRMYRRALDQGLFPSNRRLAEAIGVDLSALGKALSIGDLPDAVVQAFASPLALQFRWAKPLNDALNRAPDAVLARARELAGQRGQWNPRQVFDALMAAAGQGVERFHPPAPVPLSVGGDTVGQVSLDAGGKVLVTIRAGAVDAAHLGALADTVANFLAKRSRR